MANIVVLGSLNMDLIVRMDHLPAPGETVLGGDLVTALGGKGANQAVAAARLGGQVSMVGRVGMDAYGHAQRSALEAAGIDTQWLLTDPGALTGVAFILLDKNGQNSIVVSPGANQRMLANDVAAIKPALEHADCLVMQLETPLETVTAAAALAAQMGVKVILNPAPAQGLPKDLLCHVDTLILNETEAALLTGMPVEGDAAAHAAGKQLLSKGPRCVALTLGGRGAYWITAQHSGFVQAYTVEVVDTTAAGDAFVGAMAVALAEEWEQDLATHFACAAGAIAVTRLGAQPSLPTLAEVKSLMG
ncbi:MAG TPA: ribokinase [Longilinea sp.]|nr:ribokinase [Longilinea sp.]